MVSRWSGGNAFTVQVVNPKDWHIKGELLAVPTRLDPLDKPKHTDHRGGLVRPFERCAHVDFAGAAAAPLGLTHKATAQTHSSQGTSPPGLVRMKSPRRQCPAR